MTYFKVSHLKVYYPIRGGFFRSNIDEVKAVDDISFQLEQGESYGLVGESGCGKSTTGRAILQLVNATAGEIRYRDVDLTKLRRRDMQEYRKDIQMIFQDPYSSLNPKKRVIDLVAEPLRNFEKVSPRMERKIVQDSIEKVGLSSDSLLKYPYEFSGGQLQRIGIARALTVKPKLIVCDEPVSALDVSVRAQVLNFMQEIQKEYNLTFLFISHDLGIIQHVCDRMGIMYRGQFVEEGSCQEIYKNPQHIYTKRLIAAIPDIDPNNRDNQVKIRRELTEEYSKSYDSYFNNEGKAYSLRRISETHSVALP